MRAADGRYCRGRSGTPTHHSRTDILPGVLSLSLAEATARAAANVRLFQIRYAKILQSCGGVRGAVGRTGCVRIVADICLVTLGIDLEIDGAQRVRHSRYLFGFRLWLEVCRIVKIKLQYNNILSTCFWLQRRTYVVRERQ